MRHKTINGKGSRVDEKEKLLTKIEDAIDVTELEEELTSGVMSAMLNGIRYIIKNMDKLESEDK